MWTCDRWGCQATGVIGGLLCVVGLAASSFVRELYLLYLTYGVVLGIGSGFCYITTFKALSGWFSRKLACANFLAFAMDSVGSAVMAPFLQHLLLILGLSRTFLCLAGLFAVNSLMAVAFRRPPQIDGKDSSGARRVDIKTTRFNFRVLRNGPFVTFVISSMVLSMGSSVNYTHVPAFAKGVGIEETNTAFLIPALFIPRICSALCLGKVMDRFHHSCILFFQLAAFGLGLAQTILSTATNFPLFVTLMVSFGICEGIFFPLRPVIIEDILGKDGVSSGLGVYFGVSTLPYLTGPPLAGWMFDVTQSYQQSFLVAGGFCVVSCCVLFIIPLFENSQSETSSQESTVSKLLEPDEKPVREYCPTSKCSWKDSIVDRTEFLHGTRETDV